MALSLGIQFVILNIAFVASALPLPVRNASFTSTNYFNVDFQEPVEGLENLKVPLSLMAAAPQLDFAKNESGKSICSSTVVSDDGKLLTAAHCLEACAREAGIVAEKSTYLSIDTNRLSRMNCTMKINGVPTDFKVLAMAPCIGNGFSYLTAEYSTNCKSLDYAVLVPAHDRVPSAPCLRISTEDPVVGDDVFALGYPKFAFRSSYKKGARDSTGKSLELTSGKVIDAQGKCFVDVDEKNKGGVFAKRGEKDFPNPERTAVILSEVRRGKLIQTSTDVIAGMSGASLVNANSGEIHGITMFAEGNGDMKFCSGGGFYSSTLRMLEDLKENFPDLKLSTALKCDKRAVFPRANATKLDTTSQPKPPQDSEGIK